VKRTLVAVAIGCLSLTGVSVAHAQAPQHSASSHSRQRSRIDDGQRARIADVIRRYQVALNANDLAGVVQLFTNDAVLLPPNAPTAVGSNAVRDAYAGIFQAIDLDLTFSLAEVQVVSPEWAFLRSTSNGTITVRANGAQVQSSNHELFVLHKSQGHWKLARYSFSLVLPSAN
jgi:uncharacterized protein (TIGR02246 family)